MTELKTLKDICKEISDEYGFFAINEATMDFKSKIRAEAIKRWKFNKEKRDKITNIDLLNTLKAIEYNRFDAKMEEIKENFNLTEEELKEQTQ